MGDCIFEGMSVVVDADVMESFDAVAQGLDLDKSFVEFISEKPVFVVAALGAKPFPLFC